MKKYRFLSFSLVVFMILNSFYIECNADENNLRLVTNEIAVEEFGSSLLSLTGFYQTPASAFSYFDSAFISGFNDVSLFPFNPFSSTSVYMIGSVSNGNLQIVAFDLSDLDNFVSSVVTNRGLAIKCSDNENHTLSSINGFRCSYFKDNKTWVSATLSTFTVSFNRQKEYNITDTYETDYPVSNNKSPIYFYAPEDDYAFYTDSIVFNGSGWSLAYTNADHVYSTDDLWNYFYAPVATQGSSISNYFANICLNSLYTGVANTVTDFIMNGYVPYFNGTEVVTPEPPVIEETNENHMYFKSCTIGFSEPNNVNSFTQFGGAYAYFKYDVDQWISDHIEDYYIEIEGELQIDGRTRSGGTLLRLDPDGCTTVPLSDLFGNDVVNAGVVTYTVNRTVEQNFLQSYLYSMSNSTLTKLLQGDSSSGSSGSLLSGLTELGNYVASELRSLWVIVAPSKTVVCNRNYPESHGGLTLTPHTDFKITLDCNLQDTNGNESGEIGKMFDLFKGSDVVTDSSGLTNDNPFEDDITSDDFLPDVPNYDVITSGSGSVNVYNMTPSEIKLVIDNGLEKFINWYNTSSEVGTTVNGFWASFGIFKNNPATELYSEYFGFLPSDFKTILLGAATIGIVGGVFSMLRRKLT